MNEIRKYSDWRMPTCFLLGAVALALVIQLSSVFDIAELLYFFILAPLTAIALLLFALVKRTRSSFLLLLFYCVITFGLWKGRDEIRTTGRWLLWSKAYKAETLSQSTDKTSLKHVEWDGWGFAGNDTIVYLVFDPTDSLSAAARTRSPGKFSGLPCEVYRVRRLENNWYSVVFYTDTDWDHCT